MKNLVLAFAALAMLTPGLAHAADEVIVKEYGAQLLVTQGSDKSDSAFGPLVTSQIIDIGSLSAAFNTRTKYVVVCAKGTGFWVKFGGSSTSAVSDADGNDWVPADGRCVEHPVSADYQYLDTAADS